MVSLTEGAISVVDTPSVEAGFTSQTQIMFSYHTEGVKHLLLLNTTTATATATTTNLADEAKWWWLRLKPVWCLIFPQLDLDSHGVNTEYSHKETYTYKEKCT